MKTTFRFMSALRIQQPHGQTRASLERCTLDCKAKLCFDYSGGLLCHQWEANKPRLAVREALFAVFATVVAA